MDTAVMALTRTDEPTVELLNKVADKVICEHIPAIAEDLHIDAGFAIADKIQEKYGC